MCRTCKEVNNLAPKDALERIGEAIRQGRPAEHFKDIMDAILDTAAPEIDQDADDRWERQQRGGGRE